MWFIHSSSVIYGWISSVSIYVKKNIISIGYDIEGRSHNSTYNITNKGEAQLFKTKEELIKSL